MDFGPSVFEDAPLPTDIRLCWGMNWPRFVLHGTLAILAGVVVSLAAAALIPGLPQWAMAAIGGAVTALCAPIAVSRSRTSNGPGNEEHGTR